MSKAFSRLYPSRCCAGFSALLSPAAVGIPLLVLLFPLSIGCSQTPSKVIGHSSGLFPDIPCTLAPSLVRRHHPPSTHRPFDHKNSVYFGYSYFLIFPACCCPWSFAKEPTLLGIQLNACALVIWRHVLPEVPTMSCGLSQVPVRSIFLLFTQVNRKTR